MESPGNFSTPAITIPPRAPSPHFHAPATPPACQAKSPSPPPPLIGSSHPDYDKLLTKTLIKKNVAESEILSLKESNGELQAKLERVTEELVSSLALANLAWLACSAVAVKNKNE